MSTPEAARFDELLSRYLDSSLEAGEERELAELLADEGRAARFYEATRLDAEIAGVLAGSVPDEVMVSQVWMDVIKADESPMPAVVQPLGVGSGRRRMPVWLAAAAVLAILAAAAAVFHFRPRVAAPVVTASVPGETAGVVGGTAAAVGETARVVGGNARAEAVRGEVYLVRANGRERLAAGGLALGEGGTVETVGGGSRALVTLRDGSKIELKGDSRFAMELGSGAAGYQRLFLEKGMLVATVAKQPENVPVVFETDRATATVRGTQLALVAEPAGAYLIVTEGAVTLRRSSGGPEVLIKAGFYGHVELRGQFFPFPIDRLPRELQEELPGR